VKRTLLALVVSVATMSAPAQAKQGAGFAVTDLVKIKNVGFSVKGKTFIRRVESERITLFCEDCPPIEAVDILLSKSTDSTEERYRSGETTLAKMEALCKAKEPDCSLSPLKLNGAVGWFSQTKAAGSAISTTLLFKNGDLLTIRSMAATPKAALENGKAVRDQIAPKIVGKK
jgi:hypothetical protein